MHRYIHVPNRSQPEAIHSQRSTSTPRSTSTVNSLYDPLGFLTPITVHGRLILRELTKQAEDWDTPLPKDMETEWTRWKRSLRDLEGLQIPRPYTSFSTAGALRRELCIFADASVKAIAAVAYINLTFQTCCSTRLTRPTRRF